MSSSEGVETTDSKEEDAPSIEVADEPYIPHASLEELEVVNDNDSKEDTAQDEEGDSKEQEADDSKQDDGDSKEETASAEEQLAEQGKNNYLTLAYLCILPILHCVARSRLYQNSVYEPTPAGA